MIKGDEKVMTSEKIYSTMDEFEKEFYPLSYAAKTKPVLTNDPTSSGQRSAILLLECLKK